MSSWYSVTGKVTTVGNPEVLEIVEHLRGLTSAIEIYHEELDGGNLELSFSGGGYMSAGVIEEVDKAILALGPYTVEPAFLLYDYEGVDRGKIYVGAAEKRAAAISREALTDILALVGKLLPEDEDKLLKRLIFPSKMSTPT